MANLKLSPRQRMINMMYLVLMALLVLNVDKRILKSFHLMETNILGSSENMDEKNLLIMSGLRSNMKTDPEKTIPYLEKALQAQKITKAFNDYVDQIRSDVEDLYGGREEAAMGTELIQALKTPEKMEDHAHYFMVEDKGKRGQELKSKINETRDKLLALLKPDKDSLFKDLNTYEAVSRTNQLNAKDPPGTDAKVQSWESVNLEYQPAGALMALLSQLQFNAKSLEADVLTALAERIHLFDFKFNQIDAGIFSESNYVMEGEPYKAKVMLVASNTTSENQIVVNGEQWTDIKDGVGMLSLPTNGVGTKEVEGYILVPNPETGKADSFKFKNSYQVFKPMASVALDAMNLLYTELNNPVTISVPGFSPADLKVSISAGGSIQSEGNGTYNVKVDGTQPKVKITVYVDGRLMGQTEYRVRRVPPPTPKYGGLNLTGQSVPKAQAAAQSRILAFMGSDFAYNMSWNVQTAKAWFMPANRPQIPFTIVNGVIPQEMRRAIASANPGDKVLVEAVRVKDSQYGIERKLTDAIFFTLR